MYLFSSQFSYRPMRKKVGNLFVVLKSIRFRLLGSFNRDKVETKNAQFQAVALMVKMASSGYVRINELDSSFRSNCNTYLVDIFPKIIEVFNC
eukprot:snap_masked-scaffold_2-processed-gene-18.48-mRNA-1 protein AED:1.00 eAED:1.00 QI:0/0/0/0/1/1/2/0/92